MWKMTFCISTYLMVSMQGIYLFQSKNKHNDVLVPFSLKPYCLIYTDNTF